MHWPNWKPFHFNIFSASTCPEENPRVYPPLLCSAPIKVHPAQCNDLSEILLTLIFFKIEKDLKAWTGLSYFFCSFSMQTTPVLSTKTLVKGIWSFSWLTRDQISHLHCFLVAYQMYAHKCLCSNICILYVITYLFHMNQ